MWYTISIRLNIFMRETPDKSEQLFLKLYDTYQHAIFRHSYFRVYNHELAKDLTQDTFMNVWDYMSKGNMVKNPKALLYKIATNSIIDHTRKKKEQSLDRMEKDGFQPVAPHVLEKTIDSDIAMAKLMDILNTLDDIYREAFLLRYVEGLKPKEIAILTEESVNVISVRISRAKRQVTRILNTKNIV